MTEKILVPLDGSSYAEQVVPFVAEVAKAGKMEVVLLTVVDPANLDVTETAGEGELSPSDIGTGDGTGMNLRGEGSGGLTGMVWVAPIGSPKELSPSEGRALEDANHKSKQYLARVEPKLESAGVRTETLIGFGNPDVQIAEEAMKSGATMIAMSARSRHFWQQGALGTTTDRVVAASPMPVIVFKPMEGLSKAISVKPDTVVIPLDGAEESEAVIKPGVAFAKAMGAKVALIHVLRSDNARKRQHAERYLDKLKAKLGTMVATRVTVGDVDEEVILYADEFSHPVIAVTEHGGISIGRWIRGSTADKIIRNGGYPVMVVPPTK
jgi:nucleotide-binding universal stress UspA family protein